jgi:hypothetical protein
MLIKGLENQLEPPNTPRMPERPQESLEYRKRRKRQTEILLECTRKEEEENVCVSCCRLISVFSFPLDVVMAQSRRKKKETTQRHGRDIFRLAALLGEEKSYSQSRSHLFHIFQRY